jgi:hypothetical protein
MDIPMYEGNLDVEEMLYWFRGLDKYFNYEDVEEYKKVKHVVTRLKWHARLWWDELQDDRHCKGKKKSKVGIEWSQKSKPSLYPETTGSICFEECKI